ncbi:MAG: deoxyribose-phosphate aldolase [Coxiellaceae bacterium]|nr:deoxyribose-phosphate aldolase [Coxiellaceae bacterium]
MREFAHQLVPCLDLTLLSSSCTSADVMVLCEQAHTAYGDVAAVCIFPQWVEIAKEALEGSPVRVATVVNFPQPTLSIDEIQQKIEAAIEHGADELDVVMPYDLLAQGGQARVEKILQRCREACGHHILKIIIESGALQSGELIQQATQLVVDSGADFVKTSTGKVPVGATLSAVESMLKVLQASGATTGIKLSGGIRTVVSAYEYVQLIERYLGVDVLQSARFRIGASQLLQDITRQIEQPL